MKIAKYLSLLSVLFLAACAGSTTPTKPAAQEATQGPGAKVVAEATATTPKTIELQPTVTPTPKPVVVPEPKEPEVAPSPAKPAVEQPAPPQVAAPSVSVRCTYWSLPQEQPQLYLRHNGKYKRLELFELAFPHAQESDLPIVLYTKNGEDYVPYAQIDDLGAKDVAVIFFSDFDPKNPQKSNRLCVFNFEKEALPPGSLAIYNWFRKPVDGSINFRKNAQNEATLQSFSLKPGERCVTLPIKGKRQLCDIELTSGKGDDKKVLFSSGTLVMGAPLSTFFFLVPTASEENPVPDFKFIRVEHQ